MTAQCSPENPCDMCLQASGRFFKARDPASAAKPADTRKATPIFSGVMRYFPLALAAVARLSKAGNDKHNPGEPLHWSREKSTDHGDCIARHQITFEEVDDETGEYHAAAVAWRALAQLELLEEAKVKAALTGPMGKYDPSSDDGGWIPFDPTYCIRPLPSMRVDAKRRDGMVITNWFADDVTWTDIGSGTIVAYRPARP